MRLFVESLIALTLVGLLVGVLLYNRKQPRLLVDGLIALLLVGVLVCVVLFHREQDEVTRHYQTVRDALAVLHERAFYHSVLDKGEDGGEDVKGFPKTISPLWFRAEGLPLNAAVPGRQPWLDIAPEGDESYHPPDAVITRSDQGGFWYNPNRGIFRARVMPQWSSTATLQLYNQLNGVALEDLPHSDNPERNPIPLVTVSVAAVDQEAGEPGAVVQDTTPKKRASLINTAPEKNQ